MTDTIRALLQRAIDTHGATQQVWKAVEEMGELTQALAKLAGNAPALLRSAQAPAAPGWNPEDSPGLVAPDRSVKGATAMNPGAPNPDYNQRVDHVAEEIADVRIMLDQLCMIFDIEARAGQWRYHKLQRLKERLDAMEGNQRKGQ